MDYEGLTGVIASDVMELGEFGTMDDLTANTALDVALDKAEEAITANTLGVVDMDIGFSDPSEAITASLNLSPLKGMNGMVRKEGEGTYKVKFQSKAVTAKKVASMLTKANDIIVAYDEDLEDNELIQKAEKPIWAVKNVSGTFVIQRMK